MPTNPFLLGLIESGNLVALSGWEGSRFDFGDSWPDVDWWQIPADTGPIFVVTEAPHEGLEGSNRTARYWSPTIPGGMDVAEITGQQACWSHFGDYHSVGITADLEFHAANCANGEQRLFYDPGFSGSGFWTNQSSLKFSYQTTEVYEYIFDEGGGGGPLPPTDCPDAPAWPYNEDLSGIQDVVGVMRFTRKP